MLGQPDPIVPVRDPDTVTLSSQGPSQWPCKRVNFVSFWAGAFASVEDAEAYFGIPDEVGIYLPAEAFARDFDLGEFPPEILEVNFERVSPRPLADLLRDATFAASFLDQALEVAARQGVEQAQGIALLYNFDYRLHPAPRDAAGPLRFLGVFPYVRVSVRSNLQPVQELAHEIGCPMARVLFVLGAFSDLKKKRQREHGSQGGQMTVRDFCEHLLHCLGDDTPAALRELGLRRSEDVGRIVFGMIEKGVMRAGENETEADFAGLFNLD